MRRSRVKSVNKSTWCYGAIAVAFLVTLIVIVSVSIHEESKENMPRFQIESVDEKRTALVWDICFSVDRSLADLSVWVHYMARDYKVESVGMAGNATVSVATSLPPGAELAVLEQVMFRCNNYKDDLLEAACKDVIVVGFSSSNGGVMQGGPRLCPTVNHDRCSN